MMTRWLYSRISVVPVLLFALIALAVPLRAHAFALDLLGDITKPLFGNAKDKANGVLKYLWVQPYFGYATGSGTTTSTNSALTVTSTGTGDFEGLLYGVRGGFLLANNIHVGLDYTRQFASRTEILTPTSGTATRLTNVKTLNSMFGVSLGFDVPRTPVQAFGARYFSADMRADADYTGTGWGTGISFVLVNPFILLAEYRWLKYTTAVDLAGAQNARELKQFYIGLSFLLL